MNSDDTSTHTVSQAISQFHNSDIKAPDKFQNSEPGTSTFSQPPSRPLHTPTPDEHSPAPSSHTEATRVFSPMTSDRPEPTPLSPLMKNSKTNLIIS